MIAWSLPRVFALPCATDHKCVHEHSSPRVSPRGMSLESLSELEEQGWSDYQPHTQAQNLDETRRRAAQSTRPNQVCSSHDLSSHRLTHSFSLTLISRSFCCCLGHRFIQSVLDLRAQTPTNVTLAHTHRLRYLHCVLPIFYPHMLSQRSDNKKWTWQADSK